MIQSAQNAKYLSYLYFPGLKSNAVVDKYSNSAKMRVYQPTIEEATSHVYTYNNSQGSNIVETSFRQTVGVSDTTSTTTSVTVELSAEIQKAFGALPPYQSYGHKQKAPLGQRRFKEK